MKRLRSPRTAQWREQRSTENNAVVRLALLLDLLFTGPGHMDAYYDLFAGLVLLQLIPSTSPVCLMLCLHRAGLELEL